MEPIPRPEEPAIAARDSSVGPFLRRRPGPLAALFAVSVILLRCGFSREIHFCGTPDACFYLAQAQSLAATGHFRARFVYDLLLPHPALPNTGLDYWRPGTSLLLALAHPFGGVTLHASVLIATFAGLLLAASAFHLARQTTPTPPRWLDLPSASFVLCLLWAPLWDGSASPDSALFYGAAVGWFLALFTVRRQGWAQDALALLAAAAAYLIRNDAILLLVPLLAVLGARARRGFPPLSILLILLGFCAALAPMHLLYLRVLGTAFPPGAAQVLFLHDLGQFTRYNEPANLHALLSHGLGSLLRQRASTLALILYRVLALVVGFPAVLLLAGGWATRRERTEPAPIATGSLTWLGPATFGLATLLLYSLILPAIGEFSALRTAVGLLPSVSVATILAIDALAPTRRTAHTLLLATLAAYLVSGLMAVRREADAGNILLARDRALAASLLQMGADPAHAVIMTADPVQFSATTGFAAIPLPGNGLDAIRAEARDLHATHVMLDSEYLPSTSDRIVSALRPRDLRRLDGEHALILALPSP